MKIQTKIDITATAKQVLNEESFILCQNKGGKVVISGLLSDNSKLAKGNDLNFGLFLLPHNLVNDYVKPEYKVSTLCPSAVKNDCHKICIGEFSGHYSMKKGSAHISQIKKTVLYIADYALFIESLKNECVMLSAYAATLATKAYVRLNGFSDLNALPGTIQGLMGAGNIVFYDYTKNTPTSKTMGATVIAKSISRQTIENTSERQKVLSFIHKNNVRFSAVVMDESEKKKMVGFEFSNIRFIDGDLFDNFPVYLKESNSLHFVLILSVKGAKKTIKQMTSQVMAINHGELLEFYGELVERQTKLLAVA